MAINREAIQKVRQLSSERDRLLETLEFYAWLEEHGTSWDQIKGVRPLDNTPRSRTEFKASCRRHGKMDIWNQYNFADMVYVQRSALGYAWVKFDPEVHAEYANEVERKPHAYQGRFIDILLKTGEQLILPWPPFSQDVVYNRKRA